MLSISPDFFALLNNTSPRTIRKGTNSICNFAFKIEKTAKKFGR